MNPYRRVHPILLLAGVSATALTLILILDSLSILGMGQDDVATAASMPFRVDLHAPPQVQVGDAVHGTPYFRVEPHWMDNFGERHCEECMMVEFTPRGKGYVGAAFLTNETYDFSEAKRAVFFVMGENGGEEVSFSFAGKDIPAKEKAARAAAGELGTVFQDQEFAVTTKEVKLEQDIQRYEVSLEGLDPDKIKDVKYPFGFQVGPNDEPKTVRFYITGVFIDTVETKRPTPTETDTASN